MPNWVKNLVYVRGSQEELDKLQSMLVSHYAGENKNVAQSFFNSLLRTPEKLDENGAIEWRVKHWGTREEAIDLWYDRVDANYLELEFETAWTTPLGIFKEISKQLPSTRVGVCYASECYGINCGLIQSKGGEATVRIVDDNPVFAEPFAEKVWNFYE
jgi:hypothetical protein